MSISQSVALSLKPESLSPSGNEHHSISGSSRFYPAIRMSRQVASMSVQSPMKVGFLGFHSLHRLSVLPGKCVHFCVHITLPSSPPKNHSRSVNKEGLEVTFVFKFDLTPCD